MNLQITANSRSLYLELFGTKIVKDMPAYIYAEALYHHFLCQMIKGDVTLAFSFVKIPEDEADVEIEAKGFAPLLKSNKEVYFVSLFGVQVKVSSKAASLMAWIFCLNLMAELVEDSEIANRLYCTSQDFNHCHDQFISDNGNKMFSDDDITAIYKVLD